MSEVNTRKLYPHASIDGRPIPFEVILSAGLVKQDFTATAANGISIDDEGEVLVIYNISDHACLVQLDGSAAIPSNGAFMADLHIVPANDKIVIDPNGATTFGVVSVDGSAGTIYVVHAKKWLDTRKKQQFDRT